MTEKRAMDSADKILFHEQWLKQWKKNPFSAPPIYGEIGPASWCNHNCIFCAFDYLRKKKILLETKVLLRVIKEMGAMGVKAIQYAGEGEPLLHPNLAEIIVATKSAGIESSMLTNGVFLVKKFVDKALKGLKWFQLSIDAGRAETHAKIHQADMQDFAKLLSNLAYAITVRNSKKIPCEIGAQMLLLPQNYKEAPYLARLLKEIGADYFTLKPYSHHPLSVHSKEDVVKSGFRYSDILDIEKEVRAMASNNMEVDFRRTAINEIETERTYNRCWSVPTTWFHITADGTVWACSAYLGEDKRFLLGNINEQNFTEIWYGEKRRKLLKMMQNYDVKKHCRRVCRMNRTNITLFALKQGRRIKRGTKPGRVNFI